MMKKYFLIAAALFFCSSLYAKKVKFAVDMDTVVVNAAGVHVYGDFQVAAGYPYNLDPASTMLAQEGITTVYSIVVDIPAFHEYEYRFINGDQSYQTEFVPEASRVNGFFDDNRWIYIDSTSDDTTFIGVLPYGGNAPAGLSLVVFRVNMLLQTVSADSVHIGASFQGWNPSQSMMINFNNDMIYKYQAYIPNGTYQFKFVNGNTSGGYEYVGGACAVNGERVVVIASDTVLDPVNFGSCLVGIEENDPAENMLMFPNPSSEYSRIDFNDRNNFHLVTVTDFTGRLIRQYNCHDQSMEIENLEAGIYAVSIVSSHQEVNMKLIVQ
jgi:hypothetical protein